MTNDESQINAESQMFKEAWLAWFVNPPQCSYGLVIWHWGFFRHLPFVIPWAVALLTFVNARLATGSRIIQIYQQMFGGYRFCLAALVALCHFGFQAAGFNPGQWAVISFYTLSGLLMERQFQKLSRSGSGTRKFYLDRFLRIYPLYFAVLLLTWLGTPLFSWRGTMANVLLLPTNYSDFTGLPVLISPAWSLACEAHFYLLVPLLVLCSTKTLRILASVSLCLFVTSLFLPDPTFWTYRGLPGILFTFLSGILINRNDRVFIKTLWLIVLLLLAGFATTKLAGTGLRTGLHINVAIGYLIAVAAVPCLDKFSANMKWDKFLGLFAYPLFLCHAPLGAFLQQHWNIWQPFVLLFASCALAASLILTVEIPFDRLRYRIRNVPHG